MNWRRFLQSALILGTGTPAFAAYSFTTLYSFSGTDGAAPHANLILDAAGNVYGEALGGGANSDGTVFELAAGTHQFTTLATFNGSNGTNPCGGLIFDSVGDLYGTTEKGGASGDGTVFELAAGSNTITSLASFNGSNGNAPLCAPALDASGNLYGTTAQGGLYNDGTVFELVAGAHTPTTLVTFNDANGATPSPGLNSDLAGNLYGTTKSGGASSDGTLFELASGSHAFTTLASFNVTTGFSPSSGVICDADGDLFGGLDGGVGGSSLFELAAGSTAPTTLAVLNKASNGLSITGLIRDAEGNLFGTTNSGGPYGLGTVFELAAGTDPVTTLASFSGPNGSFTFAGLVSDTDGNLYGTTWEGGTNNDGTVFELTPIAVPEPTSFALFALTGGAVLARPRRKTKAAFKP